MSPFAATVKWSHGDRVATVGVRGRTRLNVLGREAIAETTRALHEVATREALRCLVLEGDEGAPFIGGADIQEMSALNPETARAFITGLHGLCAAIAETPVPVIAKIRAYALGGGMEVAMACDIRICERTAKWGMPEVRVGLPSVIEAALLPRLAGWGQTANLLYRGRLIEAAEARRIGLVEEVVEPSALDGAVAAAVADILQCGPQAIRMQKRLLRAWTELPLSRAIDVSIDAFADTFLADEPREGLTAFLEKRTASYVVTD